MPETMLRDARKKFETWHNKQRADNVVFDFQKELVAYCRSDVLLLKEGCLVFKRLFEHHTSFNPFEQMTIASACNSDLRKNRMEPDTTASEPILGWRRNTNHSEVSMEWLYFVEEKLQTQLRDSLSDSERDQLDFMDSHYAPVRQPILRHARSTDGEFKIPESRYSVDGYDASTNTVYEFHGCFWHGCPKCHPQRTKTHQRLLGVNMEGVYKRTQRKMSFLRSKGYGVVEMRECEWTRMKKEDPDVMEFMSGRNSVQDPLNPRDAFYEGKNQCRQVVPSCHWKGKNQVLRFYVVVPVGQQNPRIPCGPSGVHPRRAPRRTVEVFWNCTMCCCLTPKKLVPPCAPIPLRGEIDFPFVR